MRPEEIALRMEIRQMLSEAGINKITLKAMAKDVLQQEIEKQVGHALKETNINALVNNSLNSYMFRDVIREAVRNKVSQCLDIRVDVQANVNKSTKRAKECDENA